MEAHFSSMRYGRCLFIFAVKLLDIVSSLKSRLGCDLITSRMLSPNVTWLVNKLSIEFQWVAAWSFSFLGHGLLSSPPFSINWMFSSSALSLLLALIFLWRSCVFAARSDSSVQFFSMALHARFKQWFQQAMQLIFNTVAILGLRLVLSQTCPIANFETSCLRLAKVCLISATWASALKVVAVWSDIPDK